MADVYQIAMELGLDDHASEGLRSVTESLTKLVEQLELAHHGFGLLSAAVLGSAGVGLILGMTKISGAANDLSRSLTQMSMAGMDTSRAMRTVEETVGATHARRTETLQRLQELLTRLGPNAYQMLTPLTRQEEQFGIMGIKGGVTPAVEAAMQRGLTRPEQIQAYVENYLRIAQSTQGIVTPQMLQGIQRRAGAGGATWSPEFWEVGLPAFLLSGAGLGGRQNIGMALERLDQAMLQPGGLARGGVGGAVNRRALQGFLGRSLTAQDEQMMAQDPARWARTVGAQLESTYGEGHMAEIVKRLFTNPIVQQAMLFWMTTAGAQAMERQRERYAASLGSGPQAELAARRDPKYWLDRIAGDWDNFWNRIALMNKDQYLKNLQWVDGFILQMDKLATKLGPDNVQTIIAGLTGLGGAITALSVVKGLSMLLPGGTVMLAVLGIAAIIGILANLKWGDARDGLNTLAPKPPPRVSAPGEQQEGPFGNLPWYRQGIWGGMHSALSLLPPWLGGYDNTVSNRFPYPRELGTSGGTLMGGFGQLPSWLPQFLPQGDQHKSDVNVSVDLNLDGHLIGNVLISKVLDNYEFAHGPPSTNANTAWPGNSYTPQSQ